MRAGTKAEPGYWGGDTPEQSECEPGLQAVAVFHAEREPENSSEQHGGKTRFPDPAGAPVHHVREKRPRPRRADCDSLAEAAPGDQENGNAGKRREKAVDGEQHERRGLRVDAK
jgi:hypothetical protein